MRKERSESTFISVFSCGTNLGCVLVFMGPGEHQQSQCEILRRDYKLEERKPTEEKEK